MPKVLSSKSLENLKEWLQAQNINPSKINREYSDCVGVAQLLKKFYPKLVDLNNYPSRSSTKLKINNWETLNYKVLNKLGLHKNKSTIERLATATPGAMENLLYEIMMLEQVNLNNRGAELDSSERMWSENDEVLMVNVSKRVGDALIQVPQKMILFSIYEAKVRESDLKDACLDAANQKIAHLENIVLLKAERIDELCEQLAKLSVRSLEVNKNSGNKVTGNNTDDPMPFYNFEQPQLGKFSADTF